MILVLTCFAGNAQVTLNADGPNGMGTYETITAVLSPAVPFGAVEVPDSIHPEFGRHIVKVFDADLKKNVFEFYSHVKSTPPDNEPVKGKTDRQRVEIKSYASSPDNVKGTIGEIVQYKWRFKIPNGFKPTNYFTHIHQIKAVDGDDALPLFTLTLRKTAKGINKLELIYVKNQASKAIKYQNVNMSLFEEVWVEAVETITVGLHGTYSIIIKKVQDGTALLNYKNTDIQTIRTKYTSEKGIVYTANSFIRPKWGIYRSLKDIANMKDESIRFSDFSIQELTALSNESN
ncbi:hypothetical protein B0A68_06660 [Flavobacterium reichenbachii]|nr:hypothetical protein B0A68_06660 [Flavobacterium reichenbachii]